MEPHNSFAEISLKNLSHNLKVAREKTGSRNIIAVVKADAYGHGAYEVSRHLIKNGVSYLGVAFTKEAISLRESGIRVPILVFFERDNIGECFEYNLTPVVFDMKTAQRFSASAWIIAG